MVKAPSILFALLLALWGPLQASGLHLDCASYTPHTIQGSCCCSTTYHEPAAPRNAPCECHETQYPMAESQEAISAPSPASAPLAVLKPVSSLEPAPRFALNQPVPAFPPGMDAPALLTRLQRYLI